MRALDAAAVRQSLSFETLIDVIRAAFTGEIIAPARHHHTIARAGEPNATMLLMPAWDTAASGYAGVKMVTVFPGNAKRALPSVAGVYLLLSGETGEPLAVMDGRELTLWRTAATSALASRMLAREDAESLAMIGAGALAPYLVKAHASVRPIRHVTLWNRSRAGAERLANSLAGEDFTIRIETDVDAALRDADIVSAATLAHTPVVKGAALKAGAHVDLVGAFTPAMREADDETIRRALIFVDTREGMRESGDIAMPLASGTLPEARIEGDLFDISAAETPLRTHDSEITLFKSVGHAIEDLAAATAVWRHLAGL